MTDRSPANPQLSSALLETAVETYLAGRARNTQLAYRSRLQRFLVWRAEQASAPFLVQLRAYIGFLQAEGLSPRTVQAHVHTVKGLLKTAAALDETGRLARTLPALELVDPPSVRGEVQGNRLSVEQRQRLINTPGTDTLKGKRDTAMLVIMSVCGLRRAEVVSLNWGHIAEVDGYRVIKNLRSKHGRVRTVKMPPGLWELLHAYARLGELDTSPDAPVFLAMYANDTIVHGRRLSGSALGFMVRQVTEQAGVKGITPHDLRRTAASLARKGGASIEQVQIMLGHASPTTTSEYIGETLNLSDHAVDYSEIEIGE